MGSRKRLCAKYYYWQVRGDKPDKIYLEITAKELGLTDLLEDVYTGTY